MKIFAVFLIFLAINLGAQEATPTARVTQVIDFADDLNFQNLELAIVRQLQSYARSPLKGRIKFGTKIYPKKILNDSLLLLKDLVLKNMACKKTSPEKTCNDILNQELNDNFAIYRPVPNKTRKGENKEAATKFTAYYSPDFNGSSTPTQRFNRPIYRNPTLPEDQNYTRVDIDYSGALAGKGLEIFWVEESFFELYLLHIQGGGRIKIHHENGPSEIKYLSYDGKNSRSFRMIYKYMLEKGYLKPGGEGVPQQRKFLQENPDKEQEIFGSSPSYVYFKESDQEPMGLDNIPLTEGRSAAIDRRIYKTMGLITFVKTVKASHVDENGQVAKVPFSRFFLAQDTGGAIRGNARTDLYFGYGPAAELTAYNLNDMGEQYFLIKK